MNLPNGARLNDQLFHSAVHLSWAILAWPCAAVHNLWLRVMRLKSAGTLVSVKRTADVAAGGVVPDCIDCHVAKVEDELDRPSLISARNVEEQLRNDPEKMLLRYVDVYGDAVRYRNSGGKTTVAIVNPDLAEQVLKSRSVSFFEVSYQSKIRFGLKNYMKTTHDAFRLTRFFRNGLGMDFEGRIVSNLHVRLRDLLLEIAPAPPATTTSLNLSDLVSRVVFAANVDTLFGASTFSPQFYEDFLAFDKSMGHRSAPSLLKQQKLDPVKIRGAEARARLLSTLRKARASSEASGIITSIESDLKADAPDSDNVALLLLWGANVNLLPSTVWFIATLLQSEHTHVLHTLWEEHEMASVTSGSRGALTGSQFGNQRRPLLNAAAAELLRLRSRPNMYRSVSEDCTFTVQSAEAGATQTKLPPRPKVGAPKSKMGKRFSTGQLQKNTKKPTLHKARSVMIGGNDARGDLTRRSSTVGGSTALHAVSGLNSTTLKRSAITKETVHLHQGEWVWLFPRVYLHHNPRSYIQPKEFRPFQRFNVDVKAGDPGDPAMCPFRPGNHTLRVFGGGSTPCPGVKCAITMLKAAVDAILLSGLIDLHLDDPDAPLPEAMAASVSSTPPPAAAIAVSVGSAVLSE
jgi:cytochrome P450